MSENKPCYLAMCAIAKDETPYLREWIAYHHLIGFERIFLYDNESAVPVRDVVPDMAEAGMVDSFTIHGDGRQLTAYNHCLREYGHLCEWMAFFDLDEFLWLRDGLDARAFVADYEEFAGISLNECRLSSSGHLSRPAGLVLENYRQCNFDSIVMKCIVRPRYVEMPFSPHHFIYKEGRYAVACDKLPVVEAYGPLALDKAELYHYSVKSQEDFEIKINRKDATRPGNPRSHLGFYAQAAAPWVLREEMLGYAARVRAIMDSGRPDPYYPLDAASARIEPYRRALPRLQEAVKSDESPSRPEGRSGRPGLAHLLFCLNRARFRDKAAYLGLGVRACLLANDLARAREAARALLRVDQTLAAYLELLRVELAAGDSAETARIGSFIVQAAHHLEQSEPARAAKALAREYGVTL